MTIKNLLLSWSSGKDSALSLLRLREDPRYRVIGLFTTYVEDTVPFQHTPLPLVQAQANALGLPLVAIPLPEVFPSNPVYQHAVVSGIQQSRLAPQAIAFGDMFHNGIADYRRSYIEPAGWECVFPLLGWEPSVLAEEILQRDIKTRVITIDTTQLSGDYCGAWYNREWIDSLPNNVDPCGENGEFHTLVCNMPGFNRPITLKSLEINRSSRFHIQEYDWEY